MRVQVPPGAFVSGRSEVGIAPVLGTGDRKFKSCRSDQPERARKNCPHIIPGSLETEQCDVVSWVNDAPSPSGKAEDFDSSIAGSTPAGAICGYGGMADTPDLGSGASACGFDAHYPHHGHRMVAYRLLISFTIIPSSLVRVQ